MREWVKWSSLGFQMLATILLGVWLGDLLDKKYNSSHWTVILALLGTVLGLGLVLKQLLGKKK